MNAALVVGAGPAGLMAADMLSRAGHSVIIAEAMPTPARKFLMAGKSGLNLTRNESPIEFSRNITFGDECHMLFNEGGYYQHDLPAFGPVEVMNWAHRLGIDLFTGSTKRVFPVGMKASPLLRAWILQLSKQKVKFMTRWRWQGFDGEGLIFSTAEGVRRLQPGVTVLALGGASWPRLGSDGSWTDWLVERGVEIAPFKPANMGLLVNWSGAMTRHLGKALKGVAICAGGKCSRGEWVLTRNGIEGGGIYALSAALREGVLATVDLAPDMSEDQLAVRFSKPQGKLSVGNWLRRVLRDPVKVALVLEWGGGERKCAHDWSVCVKNLPVRHNGPMGLDRAISSAGGIRLGSLTPGFELRAVPGIFAAGEMLNWEAPTGGYLLTHSLGMGRHAGCAAAAYLSKTRM